MNQTVLKVAVMLTAICSNVYASVPESWTHGRVGTIPPPPARDGFSVDSLVASGLRGGRMYPAGTNFTPKANREMGEAMEVWNSRRWREGNEMFKQICRNNPDSPWAAEAELHVAAFDRLNGYFDESEDHFLAVLANYGDKSEGVKQRVLLHLPQLYWETGRPRAALASLNLIAETRMDWSRRQFYENWVRIFGNATKLEDQDRKCGAVALAMALESINLGKTGQPLVNMSMDTLVSKYPWAGVESKHPDGYSLAELAAISGGKPRKVDFATLQRMARSGSPIIACLEPPPEIKLFDRLKRKPAANYKRPPGHFVVVESITDKIVTILDPRAGRIHQEVNRFKFTWEGKILVLPGQDSKLGQELSAMVSAASRGGCCGSPTPADSMDNTAETTNNGENQPQFCTNTKGAGGVTHGVPQGAPAYRFGLPSANLNISDSPMWMPSVRGPDMAIQLDHNRTDSRNGAEFTNVNFYCFGNKWSFNYASIYREAPSENATVFLPGGRHEEYYKTNSGNYIAKNLRNKNTLQIVGGEAKLTLDLDKSAFFFSTNSEWLTRMEDCHGNAIFCHHDETTGWLTNIVDSSDRSLNFQYSTQGYVTNVTDTLGRYSAFAYSNGNLVSMTDMGGYETKLEYNTNSWITVVAYPGGLTNAFDYADGFQMGSPYDEYDGEPFRIRAVDSLRYTNEYVYHAFDSMGPISVKDQGGNAWLYGHDAQAPYSFITSDSVNEKPNTDEEYTMYGDQWVRRVYNLDGVTLSAVHYAMSPVENFLGFHTTGNYTTNHLSRYFTYDANGWLASEQWTTNGVTCAVMSNQYDNAGNLVWQMDALSAVSTFAYNDKRDLIAATNALGHSVGIGYNSDGSVAAVTNSRGHVTRWQYDNNGFNTNIVFPDNTRNAMTHDAIGRVTTFRDAAGDQSSFAYDNLDRVTNILFASDSTRMAYAYSFSGVTNISDRLLRTTAIQRDILGRVTSVLDAHGDRVGFAYDPLSNITAIHIGMGSYSNTLAFAYHSTNGYTRLARMVSAMGRTNSYDYTFRGLPSSHTDPRGVVVSNTFDFLSRVVQTSFGEGTNVDFAYDKLNRLTGMNDALTTNTFAFDAIGQVTSRTSSIMVPGFSNVSFRVDYAFDESGNLTNRIVTGTGGFTNIIAERRAFDTMNRITLVSNTFASATFGFDTAGRLAAKNYGNGDVTEYDYGPESRLVSLTTSNAGVAIQGWTYSHNAMGLITNITGTGGVREYEYNAVDRLVAENIDSTNVTVWTYDSCGNRLAASNAASIVRSTYNDDNEMTHYSQNTNDWIDVRGAVNPGPRSNKWYNSVAHLQGMARPVNPTNGQFEFASVPMSQGSNYLAITVRDVSGNMATQTVSFTKLSGVGAIVTHDAAGNLTGIVDGGMTNVYEWDAANRLTCATSNGVEVLRCWYDGGGRRIAKQEIVGGQTNWCLYIYEGWTVIAVLNESGKLLEYYTRGLGVGGDVGTVVAVTHTADSWTNGTFYFHNNYRGDVTVVRSGSATVAAYDYAAFGEVLSASGSYTSRLGFSSKELDPSTGFNYFGFRYMSPMLGRFVSADPLGLAAGLNQYVFCENNPVNNIDPEGNESRSVDLGNGYSGRVDYQNSPGGGLREHLHVYRGAQEVAKINTEGGWMPTHSGQTLLRPSDVLRSVRNRINSVARGFGRLNMVITVPLGLMDDVNLYLRGREQGRGYIDQFQEEMRNAAPFINTWFGPMPNPFFGQSRRRCDLQA